MALPSIDLGLSKKLRDPDYRKKFFLAESSAHIAKQLIGLRKRRGLNQKGLAKKANTGQPAISRAERADYHNWSFNTLRRLAEAMDARIQVFIEAAEDVLGEYVTEEVASRKANRASAASASTPLDQSEPNRRAAKERVRDIPRLSKMSEDHGISCD